MVNKFPWEVKVGEFGLARDLTSMTSRRSSRWRNPRVRNSQAHISKMITKHDSFLKVKLKHSELPPQAGYSTGQRVPLLYVNKRVMENMTDHWAFHDPDWESVSNPHKYGVITPATAKKPNHWDPPHPSLYFCSLQFEFAQSLQYLTHQVVLDQNNQQNTALFCVRANQS